MVQTHLITSLAVSATAVVGGHTHVHKAVLHKVNNTPTSSQKKEQESSLVKGNVGNVHVSKISNNGDVSKITSKTEVKKTELTNLNKQDLTLAVSTSYKYIGTGKVIGINENEQLNVRSSASESGTVIGGLFEGQTVNVIAQDGNWYEIDFNYGTGYVPISYLNYTASSTSNSTSTVSNGWTGEVSGLNAGYGLNFRQEPNTTSTVISVLNEGAKFTILQKDGSWYEVQYNGKTGYLYGDYVTVLTTPTNTSTSSTTKSSSVTPNSSTTKSTGTSTSSKATPGATKSTSKAIQSSSVGSTGSSNSSSTSTSSKNTTTKTSVTEMGTVCNLNPGCKLCVVNKPSMNGTKIGLLTEGTTFKIIGQNGDWYEISYQGQNGYVYNGFVKVTDVKTISTVPNSSSSSSTTTKATPSSSNTNSSSSTSSSSTFKSETGEVYNLNPGCKLSVLNSPNMNGTRVGLLSQGTEFTIIGQNGDWYEVQYNGNDDWVYNGFVKVVDANSNSTATGTTEIGTVYNLNTGYDLDVLSSPSMGGTVIGGITQGTEFKIIGQSGQWYELQFKGQDGYVNDGYVKVSTVKSSATPVPSTSTSPNSSKPTTTTKSSTFKPEEAKVDNLNSGCKLCIVNSPSMNGTKIGLLDEGQQITIIGKSGDWYEINYGSGKGYVYSPFIELEPNVAVPTSSSSSTSSNGSKTLNETGVVFNLNNGYNLDVVSTPSTSGTVVGDLTEGTSVTILGENGIWYEISYKGNDDWIDSQFVKVTGTSTPNSTKSSPSTSGEQIVTVTGLGSGYTLNIRSEDSTSAGIVGKASDGQSFKLVKKVGDWYEIDYDGTTAYVYGEYATVSTGTPSGSTSSSDTITETGTVSNLPSGINLNVRQGDSLSSAIIGHLMEGDTVQIIKQDGSWYEIDYNGEVAYVYDSYVSNVVKSSSSISPSSSSSSSSKATSTTDKYGVVYNLNSGYTLDVANAPGTGGVVIGALAEGDSVTIIGESEGWYEIDYNGGTAYVSSQFVKTDSNTPVTSNIDYGTVANVPNGIYLHVRSGASLNASIVGELSNGTVVEIVGTDGDWYKILYNGNVDYVYSYYVNYSTFANSTGSADSGAPASSSDDNTVPGTATTVYTNYNESLNQYVDSQYDNWDEYSWSDYYDQIDPNIANNKWEYLRTDQFRNVNIGEMNDVLQNAGVLAGQAQAFVNAAKEYNIDPVYLMSQSILETGWGSSYLASGVTISEIANENDPIYNSYGQLIGYQMIQLAQPVTVYDLYGIGAYNNTSAFSNRALIMGTTYAYEHGWTSVSSAIAGAAQFLSENYIHSAFAQNTPYKLRYNPNVNDIWHQYCTADYYGNSIGYLIGKYSYLYSNNDAFTFDYPVFE